MNCVFGKTSAGKEIGIELAMANRHGLIAGATGTGKTVTLHRLAEIFSEQGVSVFTADVKGDLAGISSAWTPSEKVKSRLEQLGITNVESRPYPSIFWDVYGKQGHPVRTTVSEMGPVLLARILDLNETQAQVLQVVFTIADDEGMLLLDMKDLREFLAWVSENASELKARYGTLSPATLGVLQRGVLNLAENGGDIFFGEPALQLEHLLQQDFSGNGVISILDSTQLLLDGKLYSTFLLWLLSELFERLPEVGDLAKPKLVFFFDEAHLLFKDTPKTLINRIEQVVRLIRSKGVGVYFITQRPTDVPDEILAQLGNRIQHALRAYTPGERKAVRSAAEAFRENPEIDTATVISELAVGEALVSTLDASGQPSIVERTLIIPPRSRIGAITPEERSACMGRSPMRAAYEQTVDRESAYEQLKQRALQQESPVERTPYGHVPTPERAPRQSNRQGVSEALVKSVVRSFGSGLGRQLVRGVLGSILGSKR